MILYIQGLARGPNFDKKWWQHKTQTICPLILPTKFHQFCLKGERGIELTRKLLMNRQTDALGNNIIQPLWHVKLVITQSFYRY